MSVSKEHLEFYRDRGYVVLEGVLSDDDLAPVIQDHIAIVDEKARQLHALGKIAKLCQGEPFETRLARLAEQLAEIEEISEIGFCPDIGVTRRRDTFEFLRNDALVDAIEPFVGPEITWNPVSHIRPKMPGTDVLFHQDAMFTTQEAKDILQVTVWLPLVPSTKENGCLQVMPGVHEQRMVYWTYAADLPEVKPVSLPMNKGDVLIMHKLTPHGSGPNTTDAVRWSMDLRYQKTGEPSPRPEWPSQIVRSRSEPASETAYEDWRDAWAQKLVETPTQLHYPRPSEPLPFDGEMYLS